MLLVSGRFCDSKTIIPEAQEHFLTPSARRDTHPFGGLGFRDADLIIEAASGAEAVYVAVEMSYTANRRDSDRAERNARYLAQHEGCLARAAVASVRNDHELQGLIDAGDIHWHQLAERDLQAA